MATDLRASRQPHPRRPRRRGRDPVVNRVYHLDRGYERVEEKLGACGAAIERITRLLMAEDARFEDGGETAASPPGARRRTTSPSSPRSCRTRSSQITEMRLDRKRRRFALLLNRFRWEDVARRRAPRPRLRTRAGRARRRGRDPRRHPRPRPHRPRHVLSLLALAFEPGEDGTGRLVLTLAGDGEIALDVECARSDLAGRHPPLYRPLEGPAHPPGVEECPTASAPTRPTSRRTSARSSR